MVEIKKGHLLKAILFDMDGVLFDSMKNHTLAWYRALSSRKIPCERDEFYQYEGATAEWTINLIFERTYHRQATKQEIEELYTLKSKYFNELPEARPMPGAKEVLKIVREHGLLPVVVTGSGQQSLLKRLTEEYAGFVDASTLVTAFDVEHGKPHPEPYLKGLKKAHAMPDEAFIIENAPLGVKAGVAAGVFTIAVNTGPIPEKQLQEAGADLIYPDMSALQKYLPQLLAGHHNRA